MKIFFKWSDSFEDNSEWVDTEEIFALEIMQKEGGFATAKVSVLSQNIRHKFARIGIETNGKIKTIFRGKVTAFPMSCEGSLMMIELLSEPSDYQEQLRKFSESNWEKYKAKNPNIVFDDLFFSEKDYDNPTIFLEGENKMFYWNMETGKLSLSDINRGAKIFEISRNDILKNSTQIKLAREPYGTIRLNLSVSWIQKVYGYLDMVPIMAQQFRNNRVNSFTNIAHMFRNFSRDGYSIIYNNFHETNPNEIGILNRFPAISNDVKIKNESGEKTVNFRRYYFDGKFVLGWEYHQKRTENVCVSIVNKKYSRRKDISIKLSAIQLSKDYPQWYAFKSYFESDRVIYGGYVYECIEAHNSDENFLAENWKRLEKIPDALADDKLSSFFATERGKSAIRYAMKKAASLMNYSGRYWILSFGLDANKFSKISVNDQVNFSDENGNVISAKVIQTKLIFDDKNREIKITVGYSPDANSDIFEKIQNYDFEIDTDSDRVQIANIVKNISVQNPPEDQQLLLTSQSFASVAEAKNFLRKHETKIHVDLHPINQKREISRTINLPDAEV